MIQPSFPMVASGPCAFPMIHNSVCRVPHKVAHIQRIVADAFNINASDMVSSLRSRSVSHPRQVAMYLSRHLTLQSLPDIGRRFGGRDHSTVMHAIQAVEARMDADSSLRATVNMLRDRLGA